jgi:hypothetical protein
MLEYEYGGQGRDWVAIEVVFVMHIKLGNKSYIRKGWRSSSVVECLLSIPKTLGSDTAFQCHSFVCSISEKPAENMLGKSILG